MRTNRPYVQIDPDVLERVRQIDLLSYLREFEPSNLVKVKGTQKMMATLYDVDVRTINYHVKKIFSDGELQEDSVIRKFRITVADGKSYSTNHYSLEMIIAVGFKVNSERAVQFRKWVNQIAKDYTIKGWVMDDERLKRGTYLTEKYFDEQLERIREIRASERKFYQKITDLYATAVDYDKNSATTRRFYATVQNKMHYAVHGHTVADRGKSRSHKRAYESCGRFF